MSRSLLLHVPADHPLNSLGEPLKTKLIAAQTNMLEMEFRDSAALCSRALDDLKIAIPVPREIHGKPPQSLGDLASKDSIQFFSDLLAGNGIPSQAISFHAANLTHRTQLIRAFSHPDDVISDTCSKVKDY